MRTIIFTLLILISLAGASDATVLTFDDITASGSGRVYDGYGGLNWTNYSVLDAEHYAYNPSGYRNGNVSGSYVAYSWLTGSVTSSADFDFIGACLTSAWNDGMVLRLAGYDDGALKYAEVVTLNTAAPLFFAGNWAGIDRLTMDVVYDWTRNGAMPGAAAFFAVDDFTFREPASVSAIAFAPAAAPVPEPGTVLLLGFGFACVAVLSKRRSSTG